jgi:Protein of unknown function (DUF3501)
MDSRALTLADIADARAYEREREEFRSRIVALKKLRRVAVGPVVSLVFENRDTVRFQIQEMARAERLLSDEAVQLELDTYNPLIPERGQLSASLFIELTSRDQMEEWLPKLVGIERSVHLEIGDGEQAVVVTGDVDPDHAGHLTREEVTAAVHFVHFSVPQAAVGRFGTGPVAVVIDHPKYGHRTSLSAETRANLLEDVSG